MTLTVAELVQAPVMGGAPVLAGRDGINREINWTAVIEWQAVGFVHPGELVLTTCIGLAEPELTQFMRELLGSGAAAVCVSLPPTGPVTEVPAAVIMEADRAGVPLIDLPWEVAFADVNRWVIDEVIQRRYAPDSFARALLGGEGMDGIAAALEVALDRPALIFDGRLQLAGHGPMAGARLGEADLAELRMDAARLTGEEALAAAAELDVEPRRVEDLLGLGPGTGLAVVARHDTLGYLFVLDAGEPDLPGLELRALEQASVAVAMEGLRRRSAADERAREDFLWLLVTGAAGPPDRIVARAALLGFERAPFELAVARADTGLERVARDLRDRATRASLELVLGVRDGILVAAAAVRPERAGALRVLIEATHEQNDGASWGVATGARPVPELAMSYVEAERALEIGRALEGPGQVADAAALAPYLMLASLGADPQAMAIARRIVGPLVAYDRSDLVETLDVYLQESANTSSAARRLHLNRHSLLYRLRKIEELTGRSLERPADRFVLDLSIKLLRFGVLDLD
jgi:PucR family transcriptional regulator, purine catabolism regulatory protein